MESTQQPVTDALAYFVLAMRLCYGLDDAMERRQAALTRKSANTPAAVQFPPHVVAAIPELKGACMCVCKGVRVRVGFLTAFFSLRVADQDMFVTPFYAWQRKMESRDAVSSLCSLSCSI
jgi:hypothetical protein